jgi:ABC-type multidrug transport system fused ATPase/permease subunit
MKVSSNKISEIYSKLEQIFGFKKRIAIFEVDFNKPWWYILVQQKWLFLSQLLNEIILKSFLTLIPLIVVSILAYRRVDLLVIFIIGWAAVNLIPWIIFLFGYGPLVSQSTQSIYYSAVKFFLTVDPIFHSTRSSGQIIAKVTRGSEVFENVVDMLLLDFFGTIIGLITTIITFIYLNPQMAIVATINYLVICLISFILRYYSSVFTVKMSIQTDDIKKEIGIESLNANNYIRSTFSTPTQLTRTKNKSFLAGVTVATMWATHLTGDMFVRLIYVISFGTFTFVTLNKISEGFDPILATTLVLTYYAGSRDLWQFGRVVQKITDGVKKMQDLFSFIRGFGKQSYPVLDSDLPKSGS